MGHDVPKHLHLPRARRVFKLASLFYLHMNAELIRERMELRLLPPSILLSRAKLLDSSSRDTPAFNDDRYFPFYYHLGYQIQPKIVYQIGAKLGLIGACMMQSCKTIERWVAMEPAKGETTPLKMILSNLLLHGGHKHSATAFWHESPPEMSHSEKMDLALLTDKYDAEKTKTYLEFFWEHLSSEGLLVVDYIHDDDVKRVFTEFHRVKNREPVLFNTRYGVGVVTR